MFQSATVKLTVWYAAIVISISILFSIIIYSIASSEVGSRIHNLQISTPPPSSRAEAMIIESIRQAQIDEAKGSLIGSLVITNLAIWLAGGFGSYYLARRTLRPIERAHEAQSRFTSDASHELRTPLASMKVELEVALRDPDLRKNEMRELLESNLEEVNKLTKLSHTLLQLSRLDHDKIILERVELNAATTTVITRFTKLQPRIVFDDIRKMHVLANETNVEELLTILIDNALKYSPTDTKVHVYLVKAKQMSGFRVVNEGEGISAQALPNIFNRFYRVDTSRTNNETKGHGLGLALAKKLVELHGGELTVSSAPQHETTFQILLPNFRKGQAKTQ